jgi:hypothetical protein
MDAQPGAAVRWSSDLPVRCKRSLAPKGEALDRIVRGNVGTRPAHQNLQTPGIPAEPVDHWREIGSLSRRGQMRARRRRRPGRAGEDGRRCRDER